MINDGYKMCLHKKAGRETRIQQRSGEEKKKKHGRKQKSGSLL